MLAAQRLADFPALGHAGRLPDTRELIVATLPYLMVYQVRVDTVVVLAVLHTSRNIPHLLKQRGEDLQKT